MRDSVIVTRVSKEELDKIKEKAKKVGLAVSSYIRMIILKEE